MHDDNPLTTVRIEIGKPTADGCTLQLTFPRQPDEDDGDVVARVTGYTQVVLAALHRHLRPRRGLWGWLWRR